ncbi:hypothetical protein ABZZ79_28255 [Streptomyces sp. NPDC006458]|uniref:hypothetical protein n=1 Tax=Streptomyces sp. NPDC006458 TaxID=3154302 RepID=UPI00339F8143
MTPAQSRYLRLVRISAWYDLVVTAGFVTPWTYALVHTALSWAGEALGLGGLPAREPAQVLYANLMGSVVVVWSVLRLRRTLPVHGLYDGVARTLFSLGLASALAAGMSGVLWLFLTVELAWGVVQLLPWWRQRAAVRRGAGRPAVGESV